MSEEDLSRRLDKTLRNTFTGGELPPQRSGPEYRFFQALADIRLMAPRSLVASYLVEKCFEIADREKFDELVALGGGPSERRVTQCDYLLLLGECARAARGKRNTLAPPGLFDKLDELTDAVTRAIEHLEPVDEELERVSDDPASDVRRHLYAWALANDFEGVDAERRNLSRCISYLRELRGRFADTDASAYRAREDFEEHPYVPDRTSQQGAPNKLWLTLFAFDVRTVYRRYYPNRPKQNLYRTVAILTEMMHGDASEPIGASGVRYHLEERVPVVHEAVANYENWPEMDAHAPFGRIVYPQHLEPGARSFESLDDLVDPDKPFLHLLKRSWKNFGRYLQ